MSDCIFIFYYCYYYSGSKPTRLFNEEEVGEEIPAGVPAKKAEVEEDPTVAGCSTEAKTQNVTPGKYWLSCLLSQTNKFHYLGSCVDLMSFDSPVSTKKM